MTEPFERLETPSVERFTLGVNYWPRRKAMRWWSDFDRGEVAEEFAVIAELGLHVVRIFLLWDDWQPVPDRVSTGRLNELVAVADIADGLGLGLDVTFFTGHMSGPNWVPGWLVGGDERPGGELLVVTKDRYIESGYRNPFTDPHALGAQRLQLAEVVRVLAQHPAIWMWNLGNEPDLFGRPTSHHGARSWVGEMASVIRAHDDRHPVTCGLHAASLIADVGFRPGDVFGELDVAVMHAYPQYVDWGREPLDPAVVPFACALTSTLSGRPVLIEEFGGCTAAPGASSYWWEWDLDGPRRQFLASEEEFAGYVDAVLAHLVRVGATGAMLWCFADYDRLLWDQPPCDSARHERFFGLVRPDGSLKPHADVVRRFAAASPRVSATPPWATFSDQRGAPLTETVFYEDPAGHVRRLFGPFAEALESQP